MYIYIYVYIFTDLRLRERQRIYGINSIECRNVLLQLNVHLCCVWRCFLELFRVSKTYINMPYCFHIVSYCYRGRWELLVHVKYWQLFCQRSCDSMYCAEKVSGLW